MEKCVLYSQQAKPILAPCPLYGSSLLGVFLGIQGFEQGQAGLAQRGSWLGYCWVMVRSESPRLFAHSQTCSES